MPIFILMGVKVMNITEVSNSITSVGFPIVACLLLFYFNKVEIEKLKESLDNNTQVLMALKEIIKGMKRGDD